MHKIRRLGNLARELISKCGIKNLYVKAQKYSSIKIKMTKIKIKQRLFCL